MVGALNLIVDFGRDNAVPQGLADEEIIDTPTHIPLTGRHAVGPPAVLYFLRVLEAPAVYETGCQKLAHLSPLLIRKTCTEMVGCRILEVYFLVRHIHIPANHHRLGLFELLQISAEIILPAHTVIQPLEFVLRVGDIGVHQEEIPEFQSNRTPFVVVLVYAYSRSYRKRMPACVDCGSGIAVLVRIIPIGFVSGKLQINLSGFQFRLLQADAIRVETLENPGKTLADHSPQAVHVPAYQFHPTETTLHRPWCPLP